MVSVTIKSQEVPVSCHSSIKVEDALESSLFKNWMADMESSTLTVKNIDIQCIDMFGPRVGFLKIKCDVFDTAGKRVPGICFLRGGAVGVLPVLHCNGEQYTLLTTQPRVPIGASQFPEIPAGMIDAEHHFAGVAAKEMKEETGLVMEASEMIDLTHMAYGDKYKGMYPSAGGCDEFLRLYLWEKDVDQSLIDDLHGKDTGAENENENIILRVIKLEDLWREAPESKALACLALGGQLSASGELKCKTNFCPASHKKKCCKCRSEDTRLNSSHIPLSRMPSSA
eukprot:TRINITY_DN18134_c0_g1_i1.p1 TRINITY_DN18134_c0_g1~~TRINITY_DN18134_c0_g1_i1.p1  ORF type:complete len:283 (-),score=102.74 TRINITY_DN18134_c0_g1_i1:68-916(-)